ncbi:Ribosomal-protein-alanine acetyltransferase [uncultured delta proteobacterium]|uniref:Ribosomal-protein-alanine acetyltransferase n=1 Tax=uncultured delta proteobacterium TaxID=34034 RepID=A0A212J4A1_9DELT|nr:Ribosomal-protein-alanine acetyltransferase [uncultured delta proteobacterium]
MMKTSGLLYRQLTEDDLDAVAALETACFPTPWTADQYRAILRQGGCTLFGAFRGDALAGYIAVSVQHSIGEMEVYNIAVAAPFRCLGIGKKLLRLALEAAARLGVTQAILEVRVSNAPALALYHALGFSQVGVRSGYYHDTGEDALVLARSLAPAE